MPRDSPRRACHQRGVLVTCCRSATPAIVNASSALPSVKRRWLRGLSPSGSASARLAATHGATRLTISFAMSETMASFRAGQALRGAGGELPSKRRQRPAPRSKSDHGAADSCSAQSKAAEPADKYANRFGYEARASNRASSPTATKEREVGQ